MLAGCAVRAAAGEAGVLFTNASSVMALSAREAAGAGGGSFRVAGAHGAGEAAGGHLPHIMIC